MIKKYVMFYAAGMIFLISAAGTCFAQEILGGRPGSGGPINLTIEKAIDLVLRKNLVLRSAKYDIVMSDTQYQAFQKKYSPNVTLDAGYMKQELPPTALSEITGTKQFQYDTSAALSKLFPSGTHISAGVREVYYDANDKQLLPNTPADPAYHKPSLFVNMQQELLKNSLSHMPRAKFTPERPPAAAVPVICCSCHQKPCRSSEWRSATFPSREKNAGGSPPPA